QPPHFSLSLRLYARRAVAAAARRWLRRAGDRAGDARAHYRRVDTLVGGAGGTRRQAADATSHAMVRALRAPRILSLPIVAIVEAGCQPLGRIVDLARGRPVATAM